MPNIEQVMSCLALLAREKHIRVVDHQFARFIAQFSQEPWSVLASALASYHSGLGHVCLDLDNIQHQLLFDLPHQEIDLLAPLALSTDKQWPVHMKQALANDSIEGENAPLMLYGSKLYLQRYWVEEQRIAQFLIARGNQFTPLAIKEPLDALFKPNIPSIYVELVKLRRLGMPLNRFCHDFFHLREDIALSPTLLAQQLAQIDNEKALAAFASTISCRDTIDWQKVAVAVAASNQFSVISGGPGTGKTTTVIKLLALLVELDQAARLAQNTLTPPLNIELVAPTGKAAARLSESISSALDKLHLAQEIKGAIPTNASTIHRLLGVIPNSNRFKHHQEAQLHVDVLIVDEASMIDISLMAKLFDAIAPHTKVVLLGDSDQLSSVEAGAIFADICGHLHQGAHYDEAIARWLNQQTGFETNVLTTETNTEPNAVSNCLARLHKSYRFGQFSGIGALASAVNNSDIAAFKKVWQQGFQDIGLHQQTETGLKQIVQMSVNGYKPYLEQVMNIANDEDARQVLQRFATFQLLVPTRNGKQGLDALNSSVEQRLNHFGFIDLTQGAWYIGRPIMITSNDHSQQLYNGDIGILMPDHQTPTNGARVYFIMSDGQLKSFLPSRLPNHETVYAMTIHKSQGSEFDDVVISMPQHWSPLLTKELLYTGITRAKKTVDIFASPALMYKTLQTKTQRLSGLGQALRSN